jgi:hypothetical protein
MGQSGGEMHSMLTGTACDLQHDAPSRQDPPQDGKDRFAVARNRRGTGGAIRESDHLSSRFSGATAATISINGRPAMCRPETSPEDPIDFADIQPNRLAYGRYNGVARQRDDLSVSALG